MTSRASTPGISALGLVSIVLLLAGCSAFDATAHGSAETTYTGASGLAKEHPEVASWLPSDATSITVVDSTRADDTMTVGFDSASAPDGCEAAERQSAPTMSVDTDVDVYAVDSVLVCGDWALARDADHWVAWTPAVEAG